MIIFIFILDHTKHRVHVDNAVSHEQSLSMAENTEMFQARHEAEALYIYYCSYIGRYLPFLSALLCFSLADVAEAGLLS